MYQTEESCVHLLLVNLFFELQHIFPKTIILFKAFNSEFSNIEIWFTDQCCKLLEVEDKTNINN